MTSGRYSGIVRVSCLVFGTVLLSDSANADFVTFNGGGSIVHESDVSRVVRRNARNFIVTFDDNIEGNDDECAVTATFEAQLSQNPNQSLQRLQSKGQVVITVGRVQNNRRQLAVHTSRNINAQERVNVIAECDD